MLVEACLGVGVVDPGMSWLLSPLMVAMVRCPVLRSLVILLQVLVVLFMALLDQVTRPVLVLVVTSVALPI